MSELVNLNKESYSNAVSSGEKTVMVDFWAPWCGPCKALTPILEEISGEMSEQVGIYKVNVDENTDLAQEHGVQSIPTLLVYKNGSLSETIVGLKTKDELKLVQHQLQTAIQEKMKLNHSNFESRLVMDRF